MLRRTAARACRPVLGDAAHCASRLAAATSGRRGHGLTLLPCRSCTTSAWLACRPASTASSSPPRRPEIGDRGMRQKCDGDAPGRAVLAQARQALSPDLSGRDPCPAELNPERRPSCPGRGASVRLCTTYVVMSCSSPMLLGRGETRESVGQSITTAGEQVGGGEGSVYGSYSVTMYTSIHSLRPPSSRMFPARQIIPPPNPRREPLADLLATARPNSRCKSHVDHSSGSETPTPRQQTARNTRNTHPDTAFITALQS